MNNLIFKDYTLNHTKDSDVLSASVPRRKKENLERRKTKQNKTKQLFKNNCHENNKCHVINVCNNAVILF